MRIRRSSFVLLGLILSFVAGEGAHAQAEHPFSEVGIPLPSAHYTPSDYGHASQNWAVTQDARGVVYVANSDGVLEYDGARWRLIPTASTDSTVLDETTRSLTTGPDGTIYVGTASNLGRLRADANGIMQFESLLDRLPPAHRRIQDVWGTEATRDAVFFQSPQSVFRWDGEAMTVLETSTSFHTAFAVGNRFFARERERGLVEYVGDSLRVVPGGDRFASTSIFMMEPFPDGRILVGTSSDGFFLFDGRDWTAFETEADDVLQQHMLYDGCALQDGHFALATLGGGALIIDAEGRLVRHLRPYREILDGVVNAVSVGHDGTLWLGLNNAGVARVDVLSPVSMFDRDMGLQGSIRQAKRLDDELYLATGTGVYVLNLRPSPREDAGSTVDGNPSAVRRLRGVPIAFDLERVGTDLLVATQGGVYRVQDGTAEPLLSSTQSVTFDLLASRQRPGQIYAGTRNGLRVITRPFEPSPRVREVPGIDAKVLSMDESDDGSLWLGTSTGVLRVRSSEDAALRPDVQTYGPSDGLPALYSSMTVIHGKVTALSKTEVVQGRLTPVGRYRFDPVPALMPGDSTDGPLRSMIEMPSGDLIAARGDRIYRAARTRTGEIEWASIKDLHFPKGASVTLYPDGEDVIWVGDGNRLLRYNVERERTITDDFFALIRQMTTITEGEVVYGGAKPTADVDFAIEHARNDVRFDVAAPLFNTITPNRYQFRLEGVDAEWSEWQTEPSVVYTNLYEGAYRLDVRARNEREVVSRPASFSFRVRPPWYRTVWAYALYGLGLVVIGFAFRRYFVVLEENERQREKSKQLDRERLANERLQQANRRLRQANEMKENFLASTSHELRTPLTNILGFSDLLREESQDHTQHYLDVIEANGRRLLRTLNALLDLASLRAGEMAPSIRRVNISATVRSVVEEYVAEVDPDVVALRAEVPARPVYALLDERYLEQILRNLLGNAVKFTEEGEITVTLRAKVRSVAIEVADTGIGIDEEFMPDLFRDFKQESQGLARTYEGSGLGLAITARLVDLMNGTITVKSEKGSGSVFTVSFPRRQTTTSSHTRNGSDVSTSRWTRTVSDPDAQS